MQITVSQKGGFAGDRIELKNVNDQSLSAEDRIQLNKLLDTSTFFSLPVTITKNETPTGFDDDLEYEIAVKTNDKSHVVSFRKNEQTKELNQLLDYLLTREIQY
jgi:hypothetical protein